MREREREKERERETESRKLLMNIFFWSIGATKGNTMGEGEIEPGT